MHLRPRDLAPFGIYGAIYAALSYARAYGFTWSVPHGVIPYYLETGLAALLGAWAALRLTRTRGESKLRNRRIEQASLAAPLGAAYLLLAAAAGLDPATMMSRPNLRFGVISISNLVFYYSGVFGIAAIREARRLPA